MKRTAVFGRKMKNTDELRRYTDDYIFEQEKFTIIKKIELSKNDFAEFCNKFLYGYGMEKPVCGNHGDGICGDSLLFHRQ